MCSVGLGTKNHCAGEDQQQLNSQSVYMYHYIQLRINVNLNNYITDNVFMWTTP
jgi:hypothetical protein